MDADDVAMPRRLELQMHFMETHPDVGVLGGAFELIDAAGKRLGVSLLPSEDHEIRRMLLDSTAFLHPSVLISRSALERVGGYRKVKYAEDYDLWLRLAEQTKLANLQEVIHQYRIPEQVSISKCKEQALWTGAAKVAAECRRNGKPDPINTLSELTPEILETMGVSRIVQQTNTARGLLRCVRNLYRGGELQFAIQALEAMRSGELASAERWIVADSHLWAARLYWSDGNVYTPSRVCCVHFRCVRSSLFDPSGKHLIGCVVPVAGSTEHDWPRSRRRDCSEGGVIIDSAEILHRS